MKNANIPFGSRIWVDHPPYRHFGIYLGSNLVAHGSKEQKFVCIDSLENFSCGREVHYSPPPPDMHPSEVWMRVQTALGKPYSLFVYNCEHFANWAQTGKPESRQVTMVSTMALATAVVAIALGFSLQKVALLVVGAGLLGITLANRGVFSSAGMTASPVSLS